MKQPLKSREREIVSLAGGLAADFTERASEHDRDASFPFENYERMREAGYLGLTVPEELGGMGASLSELLLAQERLATGCSSTALAVNMHVSPIGQLASLWRASRDPKLEEFLRGAATGEIVYASMTAERGHSILMTSNTIAERVPGGYRVSGDKIFGTESSVCTQFTSMACHDHPDGARVLFFRVPREVAGMTVKSTWDTMGMRATQSNDFTLDGVFVPDDAVFHSYPVGHFDATMLKTVWGWAMPSFGAVYLGVGLGAMEYAAEQIAKRGKESDQQVQRLFAEMEILLETARAVLHRHAGEMADDALTGAGLSVQEGMARAVLTKHVACNNAQRVVDLALEALGGAGYYKRSPLERKYRDVRAGTIMPYNNLEATDLFGKTALDIQIAPETHPEESGHRVPARS